MVLPSSGAKAGTRSLCVILLLLPAMGCSNNTQRDQAFQRGLSAVYKNNFDETIKEFTEVIRLDPKMADAYVNRGLAYAGKKDYKSAVAAVADYNEAIALDPKNIDAYISRGLVYYEYKVYDQAIADYGEAVALEPQQAAAYSALAWLLATSPDDKLRDGERAVELATTACNLSEWKNANDIANLAAAHAECGHFSEAVKWQTNAIEVGTGLLEKTETVQGQLDLYQEGKPLRDE